MRRGTPAGGSPGRSADLSARHVLVVRTLVLLLLLAALGCFVAYLLTGEARWRNLGIRLVRWTVLAGLAFFAVLILERVVEIRS